MKIQTKLLLVTVVVAILIVGVAQYILRNQKNSQQVDVEKSNLSIVTEVVNSPTDIYQKQIISLDFGNGKKFTSQAETQNAYQALVQVAKENNMTVEVKEYKYGKMVEKVGNVANNKDSFWVYSVNGKPGQLAADRYIIYAGDKVEWAYKKIQN